MIDAVKEYAGGGLEPGGDPGSRAQRTGKKSTMWSMRERHKKGGYPEPVSSRPLRRNT